MVTVTKDKRVWDITVTMTKDDIECTLENCPLKNKEE